MNLSGALFIISVSAMIPYAILAGTEVLLPLTMREALAEENPSDDEDVGILINGSFLKYDAYFAASITFPPPIPTIACAFASMLNASSIMSFILTVSNSLYSRTFIFFSFRDSITPAPNMSISPFPK